MMALCDVVRLGCWAGEARQVQDREKFFGVLLGAGIEEEEANAFWDGIVTVYEPNGKWREATSNTELSQSLGILLDSRQFPRNLLLYRLTQCMAPGLVSLREGMVRRRNLVLEGRWEHVIQNGSPVPQKRVIHIRLPDFDDYALRPLWRLICQS